MSIPSLVNTSQSTDHSQTVSEGSRRENQLYQHSCMWFQLLESTTDVGAVFFDFKKAFDMVPHMPLMSKLEELNLDHHVLVWINNYLANRHQIYTTMIPSFKCRESSNRSL